MSLWHDKPETDGTLPNFRIMRTPAGRPISGICLSTEIVGTKLHYWKGRSRPHTDDNCEACQNGHVPRWKGYLLLYCIKTKTITILEFTERIWQDLESFRTNKGTLRGAALTVRRLNNKQNGPLQILLEENLYDQTSLPREADLRAMLERIWEVGQQLLPEVVQAPEDVRNSKELKLA